MSTVEVPSALVVVAAVYTGITVLIGLAVGLMLSPVLVINRPRSAYWADWNAHALNAPWVFWHMGGLWYRIQEALGNWIIPAPQRATDVVGYMMRSQAVIALTELGIPDQLVDSPKTSEQLAAALKLHEPYLRRLLRLCARLGFLRPISVNGGSTTRYGSSSSVRYDLTSLSSVLTERHVNSVKYMVMLFGDHWPAFANLAEGVRTGQTPYKLYAKGKSHWQHMTEVPELYTRFNKAMTNFNTLTPVEAVFQAYSFKPFSHLVDVGGGLGSLTAAVLQTQPHLHATLFDMPKVVEQAKQAWAAQHAALLPRMAFKGGSFLEVGEVPAAEADGTVYVMRQILHDWGDADCLRILKQVRGAMGSKRCKLVLVEACIASNLMTTTHTPRMTGDIHMMVQYGDAMERDEEQFADLLSASGFQLQRVLPTKSLMLVLEAVPV